VEVLGLVLENFDELDDSAVADVERAVEFEYARVALGILVQLRDVFRADEHRSVLVVRIELGFFLATLGRDRVCAINESEVELPSDYSGIAYVPKIIWELPLARELKAAGLPVDLNEVL